MRKSKFLFIIALFSMLFLGACAGVDLSNVDLSNISEEDINKIIVCEEPYIRHATACCLDQDANNICDKDEATNNFEGSDLEDYDKEPWEDDDYWEKDYEEHDEYCYVSYTNAAGEVFKEKGHLEDGECVIIEEYDEQYNEEYYKDEWEDEEYYDEHYDNHWEDEWDEEYGFDEDGNYYYKAQVYAEVDYEYGKVYLEWEEFENYDFQYYKLLHSTDNPDMEYPNRAAEFVGDNPGETEFVHYLDDGVNYYRLGVVLATGDVIHGDTIEIYFDKDEWEEDDVKVYVEIDEVRGVSYIEVEIDYDYEEFEVDTTDILEIKEIIANEYDLDYDFVASIIEYEYIEEDEYYEDESEDDNNSDIETNESISDDGTNESQPS